MKAFNRLLTLSLIALSAAFYQSCAKEQFVEITEIPLTRCLQPSELKATVSSVTGNTVNVKWNPTNGSEEYVIVLASDESFSKIVHQKTVTELSIPYSVDLEADCTYYLKIQAISSKIDPSKWALYTDDDGELKAIKTFAVKDPLYPKVTERTVSSLAIAWSTTVEDYKEVDHIEYGKVGDSKTETYTLTQDDINSGTAIIKGLTASTEYDVKLMYKSASRGELVLWTTPDVTGTTEVTSSAALLNAIKTSGAKILLKQEGSPYTIEACDISNGFSLYGEETADGVKPIIYGEFHFTDTYASGESVYFEGVEFNGLDNKYGFAIQKKNGGKVDGVKIGDITYKNCNITGYSKGLLYEWGYTMEINSLNYEDCVISSINADGTQGGDVIDLRKATTIGKLNIINNTIYQGMRTFLRNDASETIGDVRIENNTLQNLCFVDNTNNAGIFGFQKKPASATMKNNLFLNFVSKSVLGSENAKYVTASDLGLSASNNWFYNVYDGFFTTSYPQGKAGYNNLAEDPCYNAKAGMFNIVASSEIYGQGIGASRWWAPYSKEPEDLTQNVLEEAKTWDLTNAKFFSGTAKEPMVRDELMIVASQDLPVTLDGAITFSSASANTKKGVPQDGYLRFKVDGPGSVILKPAGNNSAAHFTVATCAIVDGTAKPQSASVKGGASPMSCTSGTQKIVISDIAEPTTVLIYPSGALSLEKLAWSEDVTSVNTALAAPTEVKVSVESQKVGEGKDVTVSWNPVASAAGYSVVFKGKTYSVEEGLTEYTIEGKTTKMLDAGAYTVNVYALPAADDIYNTMSEAATAAFAIVPDSGGGSTETVVSTVDELKTAIGAGKTEITLAAETFDLSADAEYTGTLPITSTLALKGKDGAKVIGAFSVAGEVGDVSFTNISFQDCGKGCFITLLDSPAVNAGTITVSGCNLDGYTKSVIYGNYASTSVENFIFKGNTVVNQGAGQGIFDFRKGTYGQVIIFGNTIAGGRDFIRLDSSCACQKVDISNNTFDGIAIAAGNGFLYVRNTSAEYIVNRNLFLNETGSSTILSKGTGVAVPTNMSLNFYYNLDKTTFFGGMINEETATFKGAVLDASPVKDLANKDYTLTNGVLIACKVGDPRWNQSVVIDDPDKLTVKNAEEFKTALDAGKTAIVLAAEGSPYSFGETKSFELPANFRLSGESGKEVEFHAWFNMSGAGNDLGEVVFENVKFCGDGTEGIVLNVSGSPVAKTIKMVDCTVDNFTKSVYYGNGAASVGALVFKGITVQNHGTGQGVFDIRSGVYETVTIENSTIIGGRDLIRADAGTITNCFQFSNNTVDGSNIGINGNGIMYVRATPTVYSFINNLFLNEMNPGGNTVRLSKITGVTVPTYAKNNYVYNYDETNFFTGLMNKETAGMAALSYSPVKDAANNDYTLTDALCLSSNVGALKWNPNRGRVTSDITVTSLEEFINALGAGKTAISVKTDTLDFTKAPVEETAFSSGVLTISSSLTLIGVKTFGKQPVIKGGIKFNTGVESFVAQGLVFDGSKKTIGNLFEVSGALETSKIIVRGCEVKEYTRSLFYGSTEGSVGSASFSGLLVHDMGTGQGMFDIRKKVYGSVVIENSTIYNGCRDFIRADDPVAGSISIRNNTFSNVSIDAGNSILYVRCETGGRYVVENNLFLNETGTTTILAKTGTKVPEMKNNHFFNCSSAAFWNGTISQETATGNGGSVLDADPCTNSANAQFKLTNTTLKTAGVGDPRWR